MDILDLFKFAIAGVMILLGGILLFKKAKPAVDKNASQESPQLNATQFDLFSHLPLENDKTETPMDDNELNVNLTSVNAVLRDTSVHSPTGTVFPLVNADNMAHEESADMGHLPQAMRSKESSAAPANKKMTIKQAVVGALKPQPAAEQKKSEALPTFDADDFPMLSTQHEPMQDTMAASAAQPETPQHSRVWTGESALLDSHLEDQLSHDDHSTLAQAEQIISLYLLPEAGTLTGAQLLTALKTYGLRFGEMSLFHRYENPEGTGSLMFSVLQYTNDGPAGFDLESLAQDEVKGLAFFLGLPNPNAVHGYDMMVHISERLARDLKGNLFDEDLNKITRASYEFYRQQVVDYRSHSTI